MGGILIGGLLICIACPPAIPVVLILILLLFIVFAAASHKGPRSPRIIGKPIADMSPTQYEEYVGRVMQERGFGNVQVMGGTGDFGADVLCTDTGGQKVCVQCKKYSKPVGVSAVQEVIGARGFYGCQRAIVAATTGFTPAARQLAEKNGVELVIIN